jgi:PLP dependent protein
MVEGSVEERLEQVRAQIATAATASGRDPRSVTLVGVCKTVGREEVDAAYAAGLRHFGENRVRDAAAKFAAPLPDDAALHMIGQLQTNKAGKAIDLFTVIESVDRPSLIAELSRLASVRNRVVPVLLQVNVAGEDQKAGCEPGEATALARTIVEAPGLDLRGLMTIAPLVADPEEVRPVFRGLRTLREGLVQELGRDLPTLSMGMSNDFAVAIGEGATHVRVGRAVFGG